MERYRASAASLSASTCRYARSAPRATAASSRSASSARAIRGLVAPGPPPCRTPRRRPRRPRRRRGPRRTPGRRLDLQRPVAVASQQPPIRLRPTVAVETGRDDRGGRQLHLPEVEPAVGPRPPSGRTSTSTGASTSRPCSASHAPTTSGCSNQDGTTTSSRWSWSADHRSTAARAPANGARASPAVGAGTTLRQRRNGRSGDERHRHPSTSSWTDAGIAAAATSSIWRALARRASVPSSTRPVYLLASARPARFGARMPP